MNGHMNSCNMYVSSCVNKTLVEKKLLLQKRIYCKQKHQSDLLSLINTTIKFYYIFIIFLGLFLFQTANGDERCEQSGKGGLQADDGETSGA